jgi:flagellar basal-body rod protein FlgB
MSAGTADSKGLRQTGEGRKDRQSFNCFTQDRALRRVTLPAARGLLPQPPGKPMLPQMFSSTTIPALAETVNFAQSRHAVLAGNIANVNTPGYQIRDLNLPKFQERLREAFDEQGRLPPRAGSAPHSPGVWTGADQDPLREVRAESKNLLYHDDTNIDMEKQVAELTKNQLLHNMALSIMANQFQLLQATISERL